MTDQKVNFKGPEGKGVNKLLSSMRTGLFLLLILGAVSSIGSLITQGESEVFYKTHYGELMGSLILLLSLNKLYSSWWFILLGTIFASNILCCSIKRFKTLNSLKGLGSLLLHLSILVIFAGSLVSGLMGKSDYVELRSGESINLATKGFEEYNLKVEDFKIEYYDSFEPKQYISTVSLKGKEREVNSEISVNHPLKAEGFTIYQKSYGWKVKGHINVAGADRPFDMANGDEITVKEDIKLKVIFVPDFDPESGDLHSKTPFPNNPHLACALIQKDQMLGVEVIPETQRKVIEGYPITFSSYQKYTGLEIKQDPGVKIVYAGFILMLLGFSIRYFGPVKSTRKNEVKA